jgi:hypothetical protein
MPRKLVIYCEHCGGTGPSGTDEFLVFHCLAFCSPDCRDDYRTAHESAREQRVAAAELTEAAAKMRKVAPKRARAA